MTDSTLEARCVYKNYDDGRIEALPGMNLSIAAGEYMAITGPTEGDKSTLRYMLGRLDSPTSGEVLFRNGDLGKSISLDTYRSRNVGFVFSCISSDADIARN